MSVCDGQDVAKDLFFICLFSALGGVLVYVIAKMVGG